MNATSDDFDRDIFAPHTLPLAAYAEPDGYVRLAKMKRPQARNYAEFVPASCAAASALYDAVAQIGEWGRQYVTREADGSYGAGWRTEDAAHQYRARHGKTRYGAFLSQRDLLRSLTRADVYAVGRTDRHVEDLERGQFGDREWRTTRVSVLCLDVDMDAAWAKQEIAPIRREITVESLLADALGLAYRCFRTGKRGHQAVLPFPAPVHRSAAAWLLDAYLSLLIPFHIQSFGAAEADAHNLHGIVRVAGGRHAGTERVALWIDPTTATLMPIEAQMEMMRTGYHHPAPRTPDAKAFADAMTEIAHYLLHHHGIPHHLYASPTTRDAAFWAVVEDLPDNLLVERFRAAQEAWAVDAEDRLMAAGETAFNEEDSNHIWAAVEGAAKVGRPHGYVMPEPPADEGTRAWAARIWAIDWPAANMFWDWVSEGGSRGITAAKVLYGIDTDAALDAMLARVDSHPISRLDPVKARTRKRNIRSLWRTHQMLPSRKRDPFGGEAFANARALAKQELPRDATLLIPEIIARLNAVKRIQTRCVGDLERIIEVLLLALARGATDEMNDEEKEPDSSSVSRTHIQLSLNDVVAAVTNRWPDATPIDRSTVGRHLKRLTEGNAQCGYALVREISQTKRGALPITRYAVGSDVKATAFGATLAVEAEEIARTSSISMIPDGSVLHTRRGVFRFSPSAKRGRKSGKILMVVDNGKK